MKKKGEGDKRGRGEGKNMRRIRKFFR